MAKATESNRLERSDSLPLSIATARFVAFEQLASSTYRIRKRPLRREIDIIRTGSRRAPWRDR